MPNGQRNQNQRNRQGSGQGRSGGYRQRGQSRGHHQGRRQGLPQPTTRFHNPYNFVPTPDRSKLTAGSFSGDYNPLDQREDHSRLWPNLYTGEIPVKLTVKTPLFIAKPLQEPSNTNHKTYDCVNEVPATSIKGMLRSAYEAITNSRFGVFNDEHKKKLGLRILPSAGYIPGQVHCDENTGKWTVTLFRGSSSIGDKGMPRGPLYAAWIPAYERGHIRRPIVDNLNSFHGQKKWATIIECGHKSGRHGERTDKWTFWRVVELKDTKSQLTNLDQLALGEDSPSTRWFYKTNKHGNRITKQVEGYVVVSGKIFTRKHDERFFFSLNGDVSIPVDKSIRDEYNRLLEDYQETHKDKTPSERRSLGNHTTPGRKLRDKDFIYVELDRKGEAIRRLFPVQISRQLHTDSIWDCTASSLLPPETIKQLSPADRLWGWVAGEKTKEKISGYRGKVRIVSLKTMHKSGSVLESFGVNTTVPLATLNAPKPTQARFYMRKNNGSSLRWGEDKKNLLYDKREYAPSGRKMYWTQKDLCTTRALREYWSEPWKWQQNPYLDKYHQEYRQPFENSTQQGQETRGKTNRSIRSWIKPGTEIFFTLRVENARLEEIGALFYLLSLSQGDNPCHFQLGMGKPFGMGQVLVEKQEKPTCLIAENAEWINHYYKVLAPDLFSGSTIDVDASITAFQKIMLEDEELKPSEDPKDIQAKFENTSFVKSLLKILRGPSDAIAIHYPRTSINRIGRNRNTRREEAVRSFEWFVNNDRGGKGMRCTLPEAAPESEPRMPGLPHNPTN